MFKLKLSNPDSLKKPISAIAGLIPEANFKLKKDGLFLTAADRSMVAAVSFGMPAEAFDLWQLDEEQTIGLNLHQLQRILRRSAGKLELEVDESKLLLRLRNESIREFQLPILEISESEAPPIERLKKGFKVTLIIQSKLIDDAIKDAKLIEPSTIVLRGGPKLFMIRAESESSSTEFKLPASSEKLEIKAEEEAKSSYSLDYLEKVSAARKFSPKAVIHLGNDFPCKLDFESNKSKLSFIIAPRVES